MKKSRKYKILIIPGGGVFGVISAYFLASVSKGIASLGDTFDAYGGTSVGSLLCLAYASGASPVVVHEKFKEMSKDIFKWSWRKLSPFGPAYSNEALIAAAKEMIPGKYGNIKKPIIIPVTDFEHNTLKVYDNITKRDDVDRDAYELAVESAAAPTYFEPYKGKIDGGLTANIPILETATALQDKKGIAFEDMDIFVLGTGYRMVQKRNMAKVKRWTSVQWLKPMLNMLTEANEQKSLYLGSRMPFNSPPVFFNPIQVTGDMDDPDVIEDCEEKAQPYVGEFQMRLDKFLNGV